MTQKLFCFGYGYTCDYVHAALKQQGEWLFAGTTRDPQKKSRLNAQNIQTHIFDYSHPLDNPSHALEGVTHLLISTPPDDNGDPSFSLHADDIKHMKSLQWVGYLSTTGVYGDRQGRWVDETASPNPSSKRGSRRLKAEEQWLSLLKHYDIPVHIFRLSGIYGPGRSAIESVRAGIGRRIYKKDQVFGRIHVEDIAQTIIASINNPMPGEIFNVTDSNPAASHEVVEYACDLLGRAPPPMVDFEDANLAPMTRSFYMDSRRTSNDKIKRLLGISLKYPDYKAGLRACLQSEEKQTDDAPQKPLIFGG